MDHGNLIVWCAFIISVKLQNDRTGYVIIETTALNTAVETHFRNKC